MAMSLDETRLKEELGITQCPFEMGRGHVTLGFTRVDHFLEVLL